MVVVGTKSAGQVYGAPVEINRSIGSTARDVLYKSKIPVLVCPAKGQIYDRVFFKARHVNICTQKVTYE